MFFLVVFYETSGYLHKDKLLIALCGGLGELTDPESKSVSSYRETGRESSFLRFKERISSISTSLRCIVINNLHGYTVHQ